MTNRRAIATAGVLAVLAMAAVVAGEFVYDAAAVVGRDPRLAPPVDWLALVERSYWPTGLWRPLTLIIFGLQASLTGGAVPLVFHLVSLALYLGVTVLLVRLLLGWGVAPTAALFAGALFAVHPLHVEVVASVVGQAELVTALGLLGGALVWQRASERGADGWTLPLLLLAQVVAVGGKEQGFVLPALLLGQQLLVPGRLERRRALELLTAVGLMAVLLLLFRALVTGSLAGESPTPYLAGLGAPWRAVTAVGVIPELLRLVVSPWRLQGEYGPPELMPAPPLLARHLLGLAIVALLVVATVRWRTRRPVAALGLWWAAVAWLPASSLVAPAGVLLAERLLFLPTIGVALVIAGVMPAGTAGIRRSLRIGLVAAVALLAARTITRIPVWHDPGRYFAQLTEDAPGVFRAWYVAGVQARDDDDLELAEARLRRALVLWDRDPVVHETLGQMLRTAGRCPDAVAVFREGLALEPGRTPLRAKLGECLLAIGDSVGARSLAREGLALGQEEFRPLLRRAGGR
jgi:hypothetical protein